MLLLLLLLLSILSLIFYRIWDKQKLILTLIAVLDFIKSDLVVGYFLTA